jgi:hypothetical protein
VRAPAGLRESSLIIGDERLFYRAASEQAWSTLDSSFLPSISLVRLLKQIRNDQDSVPLHHVRRLRIRSRAFPTVAHLELHEYEDPDTHLDRIIKNPYLVAGCYGCPATLVPLAWSLLRPCVNVKTLSVDCQVSA